MTRTSKRARGEPCPRCGLSFHTADIQPPDNLLTSSACWTAFNVVLANEYSDAERMSVHHLTVDAYMAQHPGKTHDRSSISSQNKHVLALYFNREHGADPQALRKIRADVGARSANCGLWLPPPDNLSSATLAPLLMVENSDDHIHAVENWAAAVWSCWEPQRGQIAKLAQRYGLTIALASST
jgi:hypothetical protein